jgi:ABC-2 type transport system ATP-binding protein
MERVGLSAHSASVTRDLSTGWRQRLALGIALVHAPRLLFLDEPTSGVDPNARREFWNMIYALSAEGVTVLVTTHYMDEAEYCNRIGMMRAGRLLAMDTPQALKTRFVPGEVYEVYTPALLDGLAALETDPAVLRAGLAGDHLRVILAPGSDPARLERALAQVGVPVQSLQNGEPGLEDVFVSLAKEAASR